MATVYNLTILVSYFLIVIVLTQVSVSSSERNALDNVDRQEPSKEDKNQLVSRFLKHKDAKIRLLAARILNSTKDKTSKSSESASLELDDRNEIVSKDLNLQQEYQDEEKYTKDATPHGKTGDGYKEIGNDGAFQKVDKIQHQSVAIDEAFHGTKSEALSVEEEKEMDKNLQRKIPDKDISHMQKYNNLKNEHTESQEMLLENRAFPAINKTTNKDAIDTKEINKNKQNIIDENRKIKKLDINNIQSQENENKHIMKELANHLSSEQNKLHDMTLKKQSVNLVENNENAHSLEEEQQGLTSLEETNNMPPTEEEKDLPNKIESRDPKTTSEKISKTTTKAATEKLHQKANELLEHIDEDDQKELKSEALAEEQGVDARKHTEDQPNSNFIEQNREGTELKENYKTNNRKGDEKDLKETSNKAFRAENLEKEDDEEHTDKNSKNNPKEASPKLKENMRLQQEDPQQSVSRKPTTKLTKIVSSEKDIEPLKDDLNTTQKEQTKERTTTKDSGNFSFENIDRDKVKDTKIDLKFDSQHEQTEATAKAGTSSVGITSVRLKQTSVLSTKSTNPVLSSSTKENLLTNKVMTTLTNSKAIQTSSVQTSTQAVFISRIHDDTARVVESEQKKETCLPDRDDLYRKSALVSAAIGGAFIGGFLVLAVFYCKMKFSRYYKGSYQRVPVEYDFELNPRLKTHKR